MLAITCISVRSAAMMNSSGADMLAATVCPTSTCRAMTMPSMGAVMTVWPRLTSLWFNDARDWMTLASADFNCASADRTATWAASSSDAAIRFRAASSSERRNCVCASSRATVSRCTSASARARLARDCSTCDANSDGSSRAMTSPARTIELKSAYSASMMPETWLPTCTVVTASRAPVAPTVSTTSPRVRATVVTSGTNSAGRNPR